MRFCYLQKFPFSTNQHNVVSQEKRAKQCLQRDYGNIDSEFITMKYNGTQTNPVSNISHLARYRRDSSMSLKVEDVMVKKVMTIDANLTVKEAAQLMDKHEIGCLIVGKKGNPLGIITERDLLKRVVAQAKDVTKTKVKNIMSTPLTTTKPETEIEEAVKLMFQTKIKRLPVVRSQKGLVGLVTLTDMARFQPYLMKILKQLNARTSLLTDTEKNIIKKYLETDKKLDGFELTLHRCQQMQTLNGDLELINQFLAKAKKTKET